MNKTRLSSPASSSSLPSGFADLLGEVKLRIQTAQTRAMFSVNAELIRLYWDIGRIIDDERQQREGWGSSVIPRLSTELRNGLPELNGFSERNIGRMISFYRQYPDPAVILSQAAAKLRGEKNLPQAATKNADGRKLTRRVAEKVPQPVAQIAPESLL